MAYQALVIEGGLFPPDLIDEVVAGTAPGQDARSFGVKGSLSDEMQAAFSDIRTLWDAFQRRLARQRERDSRESLTSLTREALVGPVLERLDYQLAPLRKSLSVGQEGYVISHLAKASPEEPDEAAPPLHVLGFGEAIDRRTPPSRRSAYATVQEYLNRSDALWGLVTNGETLRLLRGTERLYKPAYLEVNLRALVEQNLYNEFVPVYRLLHRSRLPQGEDPAQCPLEQLYQAGIEQGGRVKEHLREGVEAALVELGTAFLRHPRSAALREALSRGTLSELAFYRQLLRLVYRLLFLMVVEERKLLFDPAAPNAAMQPLYTRYYSLARLRDRCERPVRDGAASDLWQGLLQTFRLFREDSDAKRFGMAALNGELFGEAACADVEGAGCANAALLSALRELSTFRGADGVRRRVNYAALDVEELGSVYESLLEYRPHVERSAPERFELLSGSERKQTGSYYTPPSLVHELIESALVPVVNERLAAANTTDEKERALLALRIVDPASGSGHFLLAAARRVARELAKLRSGEDEPPPPAFRLALREVIRSCIYAVDLNPLAVDLCKVALWIEGYCTGLPLSFLDQHVKLGNSLIGVFDEAVLAQGIPDEAYTPVTGDDKAAASGFKRQNRAEREGQLSLDLMGEAAARHTRFAEEFGVLAGLEEHTAAEVRAKEALYAQLRGQGGDWWTRKVACDLWTAAFFWPLLPKNPALVELVPTTSVLRRYLRQPAAGHPQVISEAVGLAERNRFFHWPLEFPEVFDGPQGGFDVVLGNPPWEQLQPEETKFFAGLAPEVAAVVPQK